MLFRVRVRVSHSEYMMGYVFSFMGSDAKVKENHIHELETGLAKLTEDSQETIKKMNKEMEDAKAEFEFKYESLKLQLEAAQIRLRELHEFGVKKAQLEKELQE
jgi:ribosomal protein L20A (L18A)